MNALEKLIVVLILSAPASGFLPAQAADWVPIMSENFEGAFPSGSWSVTGNPTWGADVYKPHGGAQSAWCARGGANGSNPASSNYSDGMNSLMEFGPVDLSYVSDATLDFYYWNDSETCCDSFSWLASVDGTTFYGDGVRGNSGGWLRKSFDLKNVPTVGNLCGRSQVYIAFRFTSDGSATAKGAFVDDIVLAVRPITRISTFATRDQTTGSTDFTGQATLSVTLTTEVAPTASILGYIVTESAGQPDLDDPRWLPSAPATCTITGGEGFVTLYAWIKDNLGFIAGATDTITYYQPSGMVIGAPATRLPGVRPGNTGLCTVTVSANSMVNIGAFEAHVEIKDKNGADASSAFTLKQRTVSSAWVTLSGAGGARDKDMPDGVASLIKRTTAGPAASAVGSAALTDIVYEYGPTTTGTFTFGLRPSSALFDSDLSSNVASQLSSPVTIKIVPLSVEADVNGDGKVNVIDLLKCRNNIGKKCPGIVPPAADVNRDGKVNVLDLIYVRNHLGKVIWSPLDPPCPQ